MNPIFSWIIAHTAQRHLRKQRCPACGTVVRVQAHAGSRADGKPVACSRCGKPLPRAIP